MECSQPRDSSVDKEWPPVTDPESRRVLYLSWWFTVETEAKKGNNLIFSLLDWLYKISPGAITQRSNKIITLASLDIHHIDKRALWSFWVVIWKLHWCSFVTWTISMSEFWLCFNCCIAEQPQPKRRRRIDRSMIGEPTNFVHTAHVGSGDLFSGMNSVSSIQNQMQSKGGYGGGMAANVQMQLVDTKAG